MPATNASPNIDNYYVGKGKVSFKPAGSGSVYREMGNCPVFQFTPKITKLDHFSSQHGVKIKDKSVVLQKEATLTITLDEWTGDNLAIALLGDFQTSGNTINIYSISQIAGSVKFEGQNDIGPNLDIEFPNCSFIPSKALSPISDQWGQIELEAEVTADETGSFGIATWSVGTEA